MAIALLVGRFSVPYRGWEGREAKAMAKISNDEILSILDSGPPPGASPPVEPELPPIPFSDYFDVPTTARRQIPIRVLVLTTLIVTLTLAVLVGGIYVLVNYAAEIGQGAVFLLTAIVGGIALVLALIYVLAPLIVVFQLAQTNRLLGEISTKLSKKERFPQGMRQSRS
jgi:hypothetical protein